MRPDTEVDAMSRMRIRLALMTCGGVLVTLHACSGVSTARAASPSPASPSVVNDWALIAQNTIAPTVVNSGQNAYGAMVPIAMYDAAVAIEGGYQPYTPAVSAPAGAQRPAAGRAAGHPRL